MTAPQATERMRTELAEQAPSGACCQRVAATVLLRWQLAGTVSQHGNMVRLRCTDAAVAVQLTRLLDAHRSRVDPSMLSCSAAGWWAALRRYGLLDDRGRPRAGLPAAQVARILGAHACDRRTLWQTALQTAGTLITTAASATLTVACPDLAVALVLVRAADRLGVPAKLPSSRDQDNAIRAGAPLTVTVRGHRAVGQLLAVLGATKTATSLAAPPPATPRQGRGGRAVGGLDGSNRARAGTAAQRQTAQVHAALDAVGETAPAAAVAAGWLRLAHPDASLVELGQHADPPVGKDTIAGRLRRLLAHAQRHQHTSAAPGHGRSHTRQQ